MNVVMLLINYGWLCIFLAVMAHESRHYNKLDPSKARPHNTARENWAFQQRSAQTIRRYRTLKNGSSK